MYSSHNYVGFSMLASAAEMRQAVMASRLVGVVGIEARTLVRIAVRALGYQELRVAWGEVRG